ncbi:MAG: alpha/beta hydrolase-fold protein [Chloroflexota bacterium]
MHRAYHRWDSPILERPMELLIYGHAGAPMIVFPTSQGRFYQYEDSGMVGALYHHIRQGWIQLICVDSIDSESWYCDWAHPRGRLYRHDQYERYILEEVVPFIQNQNSNPFLMTHGCSFGASHALLIALRHPTYFRRVLAFAGYYDMSHFLDGYYDQEVYFHNPIDFVTGLQEGQLVRDIRQLDIIMAIGRDDQAAWTNHLLSTALWNKGIWHAMRWWDGWAHDWPYWHEMIQLYVGGTD